MRRLMFLAAMLPGVAWAQSPVTCWPYAQVERDLLHQHNERPTVRMLSKNGTAIVVFATSDGATWTAMVVGPTGVTCALDSGTALEMTQQPAGEPM